MYRFAPGLSNPDWTLYHVPGGFGWRAGREPF
jgi:hypothetical protein